VVEEPEGGPASKGRFIDEDRDEEENDMATANNQEILDALREVLVDRLKVEPESVTPEANLFDDLGLDSIDLMSAVMAIEERFEIEVSDAELENVTTVGEAVDLLGGKVSAGA
jgi:acyl carrier protein